MDLESSHGSNTEKCGELEWECWDVNRRTEGRG